MCSHSDSNGNIDRMIERLRRCELLAESEVRELCNLAKETVIKEPNCLRVRAPVKVVGDIHGQFFDLKELFTIGGQVPDVNYLFMGDYVDRGYNSVETFLLLIALKVRYPSRISLIRGNHETREITQVYGFYDEVKRKYHGSPQVWNMCTEVFDCLSLCAVVEGRIFCVHGGLSPSIESIDQISPIDRRKDVYADDGPMCDLLWSDPDESNPGWNYGPRGSGYLFGIDPVRKFNTKNRLDLICRSHQLVMEGYKKIFDDMLVTVWSAPNYCYRCGNSASILEIDEQLNQNYIVFEASPQQDHDASNGIIHRKETVPQYFL